MADYTLSRKADADLNAIYAYSRETFGREKAVSYYLSLTECLEMLAEHPRSCRDAGQLRRECRWHPHESHNIYYRIRKHDIFVLRILHHAMDAPRHL